MGYKIYVDGQEGTTGLRIHEYLAKRDNLEVLKIDESKRKDLEARKKLINEADVVFLCLPDVASREAVTLVENDRTKIIDASTAFRTNVDWAYGLPELNKNQREIIKNSKRVANPGCHATAFTLAIHPLISAGILPKDYPVVCNSITGFSGGGKSLIEAYNKAGTDELALQIPRPYALGLTHKHLPEMQKINALEFAPVFIPVVSNFYKGLAVSIPLVTRLFNKKIGAKGVHALISEYYATEKFIRVMPFEAESNLDKGFFNLHECNDTNRSDIFVFGNEEQVVLMCRIDNLGKGASGAAMQNMNIMLGLEEDLGL